MELTRTIVETRRLRRSLGELALVPTMGALHEGHLSLIRRARELADKVAVSIFVNPTQFGPSDDLSEYPRPIERDLDLCRAEGVDLVFHPEVDAIYPSQETEVTVDVPALGGMLEGAHRPGHFGGVCRVCTKLFNIIEPQVACFGLKDYQQLLIIEAMVRGMSLPIRIERCATVREADGLAMSSRNAYLKPDQRRRAVALHKSLVLAQRLVADGQGDPQIVEQAMQHELEAHRPDVDYAVVRNAHTLEALDAINPSMTAAVCLVAGRLEQVRLIDNVLID